MTQDVFPADLLASGSSKQWFVHDRFGMFINWGVYSQAARIEWVKSTEEIDEQRYQLYFDHFNPDLYDPRHWARRAKEAGMKYVVMGAKHHDGFCLWDSALTDYKCTNTPYGKDLLAAYCEAFRSEGIQVGVYYSLIDWHHPDFPIDVFHPLRNHPDAKEMNKSRDMSKYREYLFGQVREIFTNYGRIDVAWFDFSYPERVYNDMPGKGRDDWNSLELLRMVRELQPGILINNRLNLNGVPGYVPDFVTPEQYSPRATPEFEGKTVTWEACHTFSGGWGYFRDEDSWKSPEQLVQLLIDCVTLDGNLLLNFGPTARGVFDHRAEAAIDIYNKWMTFNERAIYGCGPSTFPAPFGCRYTQNGNRLYLHVYNWPFRHLHLDRLAGKIEYAQFLHDASEIKWIEPTKEVDPQIGVAVPEGMVTLELPVRKPDMVVPVIEIFLKD